LRSISYVKGLNYFMGNQRVPFKGFKAFVEKFSAGVRRRAEVIAKRAGRPFLYLAASRTDKEKLCGRSCNGTGLRKDWRVCWPAWNCFTWIADPARAQALMDFPFSSSIATTSHVGQVLVPAEQVLKV
jgi:hypothetical protein